MTTLPVASSSSSVSRTLCRRALQAASSRRTYITPTRVCCNAQGTQPPKKGNTASPVGDAPPVHKPSACPAGTVLTGLSIYKDGAEVVAKPDDQYPDWLWAIISEPSMKTTSASTDGSEEVAGGGGGAASSPSGSTKGQIRAREKRELKEKRASQAAEARAQARNSRISKASKGQQVNPQTQNQLDQRDAADVERETQRALRAANRKAMKTNNFIKAS